MSPGNRQHDSKRRLKYGCHRAVTLRAPKNEGRATFNWRAIRVRNRGICLGSPHTQSPWNEADARRCTSVTMMGIPGKSVSRRFFGFRANCLLMNVSNASSNKITIMHKLTEQLIYWVAQKLCNGIIKSRNCWFTNTSMCKPSGRIGIRNETNVAQL